MKTNLPFFCFLLSASFAFTQLPDIQNFTNGENINGLTIEEDTIWITTSGGLVKFNRISGESEFFNRSNSGIPLNRLGSILKDEDGTKWIASNTGLIEFDGTNWTLHNPPDKKLSVRQFYKNPKTGNLFVLSSNGWKWRLWEFDKTDWTEFEYEHLFGEEISWFDFAPDSTMWAMRYQQDSSEIFYKYNGDTSIQTNFYLYDYCDSPCSIESFTFDKSGQLWLLVRGDILVKPSGDSWESEKLNLTWFNGIPIYIDESEIWICSEFGDFYKRSLPGGEWIEVGDLWESINHAYPLKSFAFTPEGNILQLSEEGLYEVDTTSFNLIQKIPTSNSQIGSNLTTGLAITHGQNVWAVHGDFDLVGNSSGDKLSRFSNHEWTPIPKIPYPSTHSVKQIKSDKEDNLWAITHQYLAKRSNNSWEVFDSIDLPWNALFGLGIDPNTQDIWVSGIGQMAKKTLTGFEITDLPTLFSDYPVAHIEVDNSGNIWVADYLFEEVGRYSNGEWTVFDTTDMKLEKYASHVHKLAVAPNGNVWVLTDYGIAVFDGNDWKSYSYDNLGSTLPHYAISIAFDGDDKTWIGYYRRLDDVKYYPEFGLTKIEGDTWTTYTFDDTRLPFSYITALAVDSFHNVWIGTELEGVAVFNEEDIVLNIQNPDYSERIQPIKIEVMPNPFSEEAVLKYELSSNSEVKLIVTSSQGKIVLNKKLGQKIPGNYEHILKKENLPPGVYFVSVNTQNHIQTSKIVLTN